LIGDFLDDAKGEFPLRWSASTVVEVAYIRRGGALLQLVYLFQQGILTVTGFRSKWTGSISAIPTLPHDRLIEPTNQFSKESINRWIEQIL
jgi:hypothetical protein